MREAESGGRARWCRCFIITGLVEEVGGGEQVQCGSDNRPDRDISVTMNVSNI